jgi:hypothetical protein
VKFCLFFCLIGLPFAGFTQVNINGKVLDQKGRPLMGASIVIQDSYDGATSDSAGSFSFVTYETGNRVLMITLSGYSSYEKKILIEKQPITIAASIREQITELKAVVISAGSFEAGDQKKTTVLSSIDVVTTAGANADIVGALKTLPGTQQVGESEGLFVRGGSAGESKTFIDGALVNNFFFSSTPGIATRGRFNPFLFKGTVFSAGGYSALYGQALSAALILESKDLPDRTEADLSLSVIGVGGGIQKLAKNKKSAWGFSYNYTNLALAFALIKQRQDFFNTPLYHQGDLNGRWKTRGGGFIKYYGYASWNRTGFRTADLDSVQLQDAFGIENLNTFQNLSWRQPLGKGWKSYAVVSFSTNKDDIQNELQDATDQKIVLQAPTYLATKNFSVANRATYFQAKWMLEKKWKGLNATRFGADYFFSNEKTNFTLYTGQVFPQTIKDQLTAPFIENDFYLTNNVATRIGARLEYSHLMGKWNLAPRASIAYKFPDRSQLSFAYGLFYQNPERRYLPAISSDLRFARAAHYILQFQKQNSVRTFRLETYYKTYTDLFKTAVNYTGQQLTANNNGYGYARGVELFWRDKKSIKNLDYWISYSFVDTKRDYLNYPGSLQPNFVATHTGALVMKKFVTAWKTGFNASYTLASGRPYYNFKIDPFSGQTSIADQGKTIPYQSLGFSMNYLPNIGKKNTKTFVVWVLSVTNVLNQKQVFGYNYSYTGNRKEAIVPPSRSFVFIGAFFSFGIDRTQDAINNNL